jgi:hypothetical protein
MNPGTLNKTTDESRVFDFDFSQQPEIIAGDTIASASLSQTLLYGIGTVTLGTPNISGGKVNFVVSGGTDQSSHRIDCNITTTAGRIISGCGILTVDNACLSTTEQPAVTFAEKMLEKIEGVLTGRLGRDEITYSINGRSFTAKSDQQLLDARAWFRNEVNQERARGKNRRILTRFTQPC